MFRFDKFGPMDVLHADQVGVSQPGALEVLISVGAASVNPVDYKIRSGLYPVVGEDRLPYTLGRDVSGVIEVCGPQATAFKVGDEVFGLVDMHGGGYSQKVVLNQAAIATKPAGMGHIQAASIPVAGQTAFQGLFWYGDLKAGQSVLILGGAGGVGHFAIQFAKAMGTRVLTTVSTSNMAFAKALGADVVIDYQTPKVRDHASNLDVVFDLVGGTSREDAWGVLKRGGVLVTTLDTPTQETAHQYGVRALRYTVEPDGNQLAEIAKLITSGKVKPHIEKVFPFSRAIDALGLVEQGHAVGKVVMQV